MAPGDNDLDEEIRGHLALSERERIEAGEDPEAARRAALKEFGNVTLTRESMRSVWRARWRNLAADLWQDVRYAVRLLTRSPGFSAVVVLVLSLGIAANAVVFGLFKAAFLTPLPGVSWANDLAVIVQYSKDGQPST